MWQDLNYSNDWAAIDSFWGGRLSSQSRMRDIQNSFDSQRTRNCYLNRLFVGGRQDGRNDSEHTRKFNPGYSMQWNLRVARMECESPEHTLYSANRDINAALWFENAVPLQSGWAKKLGAKIS